MDALLARERAAAIASEDGESWAQRCEAAYPAVYRALVAIGASESDAADAVQDAFEEALRHRAPVVRADGWLFVAASRRWRRARWRQRIFHPLELVRGIVVNEPDEVIDLLTELGRLTERQRTIVVARYVLGLSQREIAELLGIAPGTVAATAHQTTALLRQRLTGGAK
jgi:RNA polymerase sigma factor (sigma-70 family)